jgi:dTDP-4-dehydrorhamnose 3,5-epimerase
LPTNRAVLAQNDITGVEERNGLELAIRRQAARDLGKVISRPDSADLIAGVVIEAMQVYPDDRGFFFELARLGSSGIASSMVPDGHRQIQISTTLTYPGTIKAIHYHFEQTDLWAPVAGMLQVMLYDLRRNSPTFGVTNTLYAGVHQPWKILIPPGVGHGYKVLGTQPAQLVYVTDRYYNPKDEGRLQYDHPDIAYDWELQHK